MKKIIALFLALTLLLCGCGGQTGEAKPENAGTEDVLAELTAGNSTEALTASSAEANDELATVPTTEPEQVYRNPLNGMELEEPWTKRVFGVSIGNSKDSLCHFGVSKADILFESYVNGLTTRRFAMFSDMAAVESVGGSRSMRMQFTDMTQAYDAIAIYAGGSEHVIGDLNMSGIEGIIAQQWGADFHYRAEDRGLNYEHVLMVKGPEVVAYAESLGYDVTQDPDKDYGFRFTEDGAPADGEAADTVTVGFTWSTSVKETVLTYNSEYQAYTLSQYDIECVDAYYETPETFKNIFVLLCKGYNENVYHMVETVGEGDGYFACDGKIVPIKWYRENATSPFTFTLTDGTQLYQGVGNSYIALAPIGSYVNYQAAAE